MEFNYKELAKDFLAATKDVFARQSSASPCVYFYKGKFDYSRGDTLGGHAGPVYQNLADIVIDTEELRSLVNDYEEFDAVIKLEEYLRTYIAAQKPIRARLNYDELVENVIKVVKKAGEWTLGGGSGECQLYVRIDPETGYAVKYFWETFAGHNSWVEGEDIVHLWTEKWFDPLENENYADWLEGEFLDDPELEKAFVKKYEEEYGEKPERPYWEWEAFAKYFPEKWDEFLESWAETALEHYLDELEYSDRFKYALESLDAEGIDVSNEYPRSDELAEKEA